jgi:hypothetical protein
VLRCAVRRCARRQVVGAVEDGEELRQLQESVPPMDPTPSPTAVPLELDALHDIYVRTGGRTHWRSKRGWADRFDAPVATPSRRPTVLSDPCQQKWDGIVCDGPHVIAM